MYYDRDAVEKRVNSTLKCGSSCRDRPKIFQLLTDKLLAQIEKAPSQDDNTLMQAATSTPCSNCAGRVMLVSGALLLLKRFRILEENFFPLMEDSLHQKSPRCTEEYDLKVPTNAFFMPIEEELPSLMAMPPGATRDSEVAKLIKKLTKDKCFICPDAQHRVEGLTLGLTEWLALNDPKEESVPEAVAVPKQKKATGLLFKEPPEAIVERVSHDPFYLRLLRLEYIGDEEIQKLYAHDLMMDLRVLTAFGLNSFTTCIVGRDGSKADSLSILLESGIISQFRALKSVSNAKVLDAKVGHLRYAGNLNGVGVMTTDQYLKLDAFSRLLKASGRSVSTLYEYLRDVPESGMSSGERFIRDNLNRSLIGYSETYSLYFARI